MALTYEHIQHEVRHSVDQRVFVRMLAALEAKGDTYLMARERPRGFAEKALNVALFKDLTGMGFDLLRSRVISWFGLSKTSFQANQEKIRACLAQWAQTAIPIGNLHQWRTHAADVPLPRAIPRAELIIDSCDFRRKGKRKMSRKAEYWSFKENGPAIRVQCIVDLLGYIRYLSDWYSPKVYDSAFIRIKRKEWDVRVDGTSGCLAGSTVLADCHYASGAREYERVSWITPRLKERRKKGDHLPEDGDIGGLAQTKEREEFNDQLGHIRGRVEHPFGLIKNKWKGLQLFYECKEQQWYLILIACAVHNELIRLSRGIR